MEKYDLAELFVLSFYLYAECIALGLQEMMTQKYVIVSLRAKG